MDTFTSRTDWREDALNETLAAEIHCGGMEGLLAAIRRHDPALSTVTIWPDRRRLMSFLQEETQNLQDLQAGSNRYFNDAWGDDRWAYIGWFRCEWQSHVFELAFCPTTSGEGRVVCIGGKAGALDDFATAVSDYTLRPEGRALRYASGWELAPELDKELGRVTWDDLILPQTTLEVVRQGTESFFAQRGAFKELGVAWRRGLLLIGPPGTGKTMICKAIASSLPDLPFLYVRDLRERMEKEAINSIFIRARKLAPCLLVFEDLDGLVNQYNRTVFLNELDGFANNEGIFIVASSNHPDKIDLALLRRPSRFDRAVHIGLPEANERRRYCELLLSRKEIETRLTRDFDREETIDEIVERSDGLTLAYLKEVIVASVLRMAQAGITDLDARFADALINEARDLKKQLKKLKNPDALGTMTSGDDVVGFRR